MVEGDGGEAERVGGCEGLEEAVGGRGRGPGDVEVVEHGGDDVVEVVASLLAGHHGLEVVAIGDVLVRVQGLLVWCFLRRFGVQLMESRAVAGCVRRGARG